MLLSFLVLDGISLCDGPCFRGKDNLPPSVITIIHQQDVR
jgi:hypothetical protein